MSQVITELTLIIELKRHIESSFENRTQNIMTYSKRKRRKKEKKISKWWFTKLSFKYKKASNDNLKLVQKWIKQSLSTLSILNWYIFQHHWT